MQLERKELQVTGTGRGPPPVCRRGPSSGDREWFVQGFLALGLYRSGRVQVSHFPVQFAVTISLPLLSANINQLCADRAAVCLVSDSLAAAAAWDRAKQELHNCYSDLAEEISFVKQIRCRPVPEANTKVSFQDSTDTSTTRREGCICL